MKLIAFTHNQKKQIGAIDDKYVVPVDENGPDNLIDFFAAGNTVKQQLADRISSGNHRIALEEITLEAPIPKPPKFFGVALNYADHIEETGLDRPEYPTLFF